MLMSVRVANKVVKGLLRSPLHPVLSRTVDVVGYTGRRSGRRFSTPTQYVASGDDVIILVGHPETKTWWRNFRDAHDLDVLVRGRWRPMTARAIVGAEEPDAVAPLLDAYLNRFPKAARTLGASAPTRVRRAVIVHCQPR
jgi:deazaflavin-dependent oxidoreductase (nitroreductase family)